MMSGLSKKNRREILKAAAAFAIPTIIPASAIGLEDKTAPSERIEMGFIGTGGKGRHNIEQFLPFGDCQIVAVCDVDRGHADQAKQLVDAKYGNTDCSIAANFRELCARVDIETICVSTPDHWHALATIAALDAGKDVYCEKPLANSVAEGRAICQAQVRNKAIVQTGSHERSGDSRREACELVRNGRIGKLQEIRIQLPIGEWHHKNVAEWTDPQPKMAIPEGLDWDAWLGHTPLADYTEKRCHFWWRFILAYGGGEMTDRGAHVIDLAQLGSDNDSTGPVEISATGSKNTTGLFDAFTQFEFENVYSDGLRMIGNNEGPRGVRFVGDEGWIFIHVHDDKVETSDSKLLEPMRNAKIELGRSPGHHRNFVDCVRSREQPIATAEVGHRTATICHLNNIAMTVGRKLRWDPAKERIIDDVEADKMLAPTMRSPWRLPG